MAFKINYETLPYPTTGPGSKWVVVQRETSSTGHVVTWKGPHTNSDYTFRCNENDFGWSIQFKQIRPATPAEVRLYDLTGKPIKV